MILCDVVESLAPFSDNWGWNAKEAFRFDLAGGRSGGEVLHTTVPPGIPRGQASLRVCLQDKDLLRKVRFAPDSGYMDRVNLFMGLLQQKDPDVESFAYRDPKGWIKIFGGENVRLVIAGHEHTKITEPEGAALMAQFGAHFADCRHFYSMMGHLGCGPDGLQKGDRICVVPNCRVPLIFRRVGPKHYKFVSTCFVLGLMDGEAGGMVARGETFLEELQVC